MTCLTFEWKMQTIAYIYVSLSYLIRKNGKHSNFCGWMKKWSWNRGPMREHLFGCNDQHFFFFIQCFKIPVNLSLSHAGSGEVKGRNAITLIITIKYKMDETWKKLWLNLWIIPFHQQSSWGGKRMFSSGILVEIKKKNAVLVSNILSQPFEWMPNRQNNSEIK